MFVQPSAANFVRSHVVKVLSALGYCLMTFVNNCSCPLCIAHTLMMRHTTARFRDFAVYSGEIDLPGTTAEIMSPFVTGNPPCVRIPVPARAVRGAGRCARRCCRARLRAASLSYADLETRANRLAHYLRARRRPRLLRGPRPRPLRAAHHRHPGLPPAGPPMCRSIRRIPTSASATWSRKPTSRCC